MPFAYFAFAREITDRGSKDDIFYTQHTHSLLFVLVGGGDPGENEKRRRKEEEGTERERNEEVTLCRRR